MVCDSALACYSQYKTVWNNEMVVKVCGLFTLRHGYLSDRLGEEIQGISIAVKAGKRHTHTNK